MNMVFDALIMVNKLDKLFRTRKCEIEKVLTPYFYAYYNGFFDHPEKFESYIGFVNHIANLTNAKDKVVLDAGCGFGLISLLFCSLGAKVIGIDLNPEKVLVAHRICAVLGLKPANLQFIRGDLINMPFGTEEFDVIICNEVISHVRNKTIFLNELRRVLRRHGLLHISDGNNSLDFIGRVKRRTLWRKAELGPVDIKRLRQNDIPLPWLAVRARLIKTHYPNLSTELVVKLAIESAGLCGGEIEQAVEEYLRTGKISKSPNFKYRNPLTGEYPEMEFNPLKIIKQLDHMLFSAKLLKPFLAINLRASEVLLNSIKASIEVLYPLSIVVCPQFEVIAEKL